MTSTVRRRATPAILLAASLAALTAAASGQTPAPDGPGRSMGFHVMRRAYLGLTLLDMTPELRAHFGAPRDAGVMISEVVRDSPAARAGIAVGDVVTRIDGEPVQRFGDLSRAVAEHAKGDKVEIELVRNGAAKKVSVTVDERESEGLLEKKKGYMILPRDGGPERTIVIDGDEPWPAGSGELMEHFFRDPGWQAKLGDLNECDRVRKRLEEVEARLKALEQRLASK